MHLGRMVRKITPLVTYRNPREDIELPPVRYVGIFSRSHTQLRKRADPDCCFDCPNRRIYAALIHEALEARVIERRVSNVYCSVNKQVQSCTVSVVI